MELAPVAFKDLKVSDGEIEILCRQRERGAAVVIDLVIEMSETVHKRIEFGLVTFRVGDGSRFGLFLGEGLVGVGLFFEEICGGAYEDENDDCHHNEDEAACKW